MSFQGPNRLSLMPLSRKTPCDSASATDATGHRCFFPFSLLSVKRRSHSPTSRGSEHIHRTDVNNLPSIDESRELLSVIRRSTESIMHAILDSQPRVPEGARNGVVFSFDSRSPIEWRSGLWYGSIWIFIGIQFTALREIHRCRSCV